MVRVIFYKAVSSKISPKKAQIIAADITYDGKKYTCKGNKNFLGALPPETESPENIIAAMQLLPRRYTGGYIRAEFIEGKKKGSSESGHYGHSGLPGVWGGSTPSGRALDRESARETIEKVPDTDEGKFVDAAGNDQDEYADFLGGGINETLLVNYEGDGQGVWKALSGRLHDGHAEIIVSEVDNMLGLDLVPPTVYSEFEGMPGTSQMYIEEALTGRKLGWEGRKAVWRGGHPSGESLVLLDYLVGNQDRHLGNWLLGDNGKLYAIDNGYCNFGSSIKIQLSARYRSGGFLPLASFDAGKHTFSSDLVSKLRHLIGKNTDGVRRAGHPKYKAFRAMFPEQTLYQRGDAIQSVWNKMVDIVIADGEIKWW